MPFNGDTFDFIFCRAAFKNFDEPVKALNEMHRVVKNKGKVFITDLRKDVTDEEIDKCVKNMKVGRINSFITRLTFKTMLIKRAYTKDQFEKFISHSNFKKYRIDENPLGFDIWLEKQ